MKWPVAPSTGTAQLLLDLYGDPRASEAQPSDLPGELLHRRLGTVGAALCWSQRRREVNKRYQCTAQQAKVELKRLRELAVRTEPSALFYLMGRGAPIPRRSGCLIPCSLTCFVMKRLCCTCVAVIRRSWCAAKKTCGTACVVSRLARPHAPSQGEIRAPI